MLNIFKLVLLVLIFTGCGSVKKYTLLSNDQNFSSQIENKKIALDYKILPYDRLLVALYKNPEASSETLIVSNAGLSQKMQEEGLLVSGDGHISLPLINRIKVSGMTQTEASQYITDLYKVYLKVPNAYVEVMNKRVYVIGEVRKAGAVILDREKLNILEAIALAGDFTDDAVRDNIIILSQDANRKLYLRSVDLTKFDPKEFATMMLEPNDIVYVQPDSWKQIKINSENFLTPFNVISQFAQPFVTLKYLNN